MNQLFKPSPHFFKTMFKELLHVNYFGIPTDFDGNLITNYRF